MPEWARGRTAEEVLTMTSAMMNSFQRAGYATPQTQAPVQQYAPPVVQTPTPQRIDPEAYLTGQQAMDLAQRYAQDAQIPAQRAIQNASSAILGIAEMRHPKEFGKYKPEIMGILSQVPRDQWTLDTVDTAVKLVKADHLADYRSEWEQEYRGTLEPSMRSIGNAGTAPVTPEDTSQSLESEKIPADWKLRAQKAGITEATVQEFCRANDMTPAQFFQQFDGKLVTEGSLT